MKVGPNQAISIISELCLLKGVEFIVLFVESRKLEMHKPAEEKCLSRKRFFWRLATPAPKLSLNSLDFS